MPFVAFPEQARRTPRGVSPSGHQPRDPLPSFDPHLSHPPACSPESLRSRNDVFYLQPERSCIAESPLWYSVIPMDKSMLESMLNRILAVREIYEEHSRGAGGLDDDMD